MSSSPIDVEAVEAEVLEAEAARRRVINASDVEAVGRLVRDDVTHTHVRGMTHDKATYLAALSTRPRTVERKNLRVRVYGDVAVMTGLLVNHMQPPGGGDAVVTKAAAVQVWVRSNDDAWQLAAFQATMVDG